MIIKINIGGRKKPKKALGIWDIPKTSTTRRKKKKKETLLR
jgi:hypothetical protein